MTATRQHLLVWASLLVLLALTAASSRVDLGWVNVTINIAIAGAKSLVILLFFMGLKAPSPLPRLALGVGLLWLAIMYGLVFVDYATR
jgi:cytochrome c oxidase subunit 4